MPVALHLIYPKVPFEPPPSEPEPDAPFVPSPGPGANPDVPNNPSSDDVPKLPDQKDAPDRPEPDPEMPDNKETDA